MRVGTSNKFCDVLNKIKDHPHACGDKIYITLLRFFDIGSSPCVWGQDHRKLMICVCCRIIPMRVGTSCYQTQSLQSDKDHPHACGDKYLTRHMIQV